MSAANSDAAALQNFDLGTFEVVVVDSNASEKKRGPSLCETIERNHPDTSILHTSHRNNNLSGASKKIVDSYLVEPFDGVELVTLVRALLKLRPNQDGLTRGRGAVAAGPGCRRSHHPRIEIC